MIQTKKESNRKAGTKNSQAHYIKTITHYNDGNNGDSNK